MEFSFAFVTDTHIKVAEDSPGLPAGGERYCRSFLRQAARANVRFVMHGGDVACGGHGFEATPEQFRRSMRRAKELEATLGLPR